VPSASFIRRLLVVTTCFQRLNLLADAVYAKKILFVKSFVGDEVPQWADVYEPDVDVRLDLQPNALFFIPSAREIISDQKNETIASLAQHAGALKRQGRKAVAGKSAIKKIMDCEPVVYGSAIGFIAVANDLVGSTIFSTADIVACVFKIENLEAIAKAKGLDAPAIATASGVPLRIVHSAIANYRICFRHAEALFRACADPGLQLTDFILTRCRNDGRTSVRWDDPHYVYRRENLQPAPPTGHHWAIA
jgi:hypothetical protein